MPAAVAAATVGGGDGDCLAGDDGGGFIAADFASAVVLLPLLPRILMSPLCEAACLQARSILVEIRRFGKTAPRRNDDETEKFLPILIRFQNFRFSLHLSCLKVHNNTRIVQDQNQTERRLKVLRVCWHDNLLFIKFDISIYMIQDISTNQKEISLKL